jgi:death-on-curing protein
MNVAWTWVAPDVVQAIHDRQIWEHGGRDAAPDAELLSEALAQPAAMAACEAADVAALAAAYACALVAKRPFCDGNERTAWVVARLFIAINGWGFKFSPTEATFKITSLTAGLLDEPTFADWIRTGLIPPISTADAAVPAMRSSAPPSPDKATGPRPRETE